MLLNSFLKNVPHRRHYRGFGLRAQIACVSILALQLTGYISLGKWELLFFKILIILLNITSPQSLHLAIEFTFLKTCQSFSLTKWIPSILLPFPLFFQQMPRFPVRIKITVGEYKFNVLLYARLDLDPVTCWLLQASRIHWTREKTQVWGHPPLCNHKSLGMSH